MDINRKTVEKVLASCGHITPDCPWAVWEQFVSEASIALTELLRRLVEEERQQEEMSDWVDECEAKYIAERVRISLKEGTVPNG